MYIVTDVMGNNVNLLEFGEGKKKVMSLENAQAVIEKTISDRVVTISKFVSAVGIDFSEKWIKWNSERTKVTIEIPYANILVETFEIHSVDGNGVDEFQISIPAGIMTAYVDRCSEMPSAGIKFSAKNSHETIDIVCAEAGSGKSDDPYKNNNGGSSNDIVLYSYTDPASGHCTNKTIIKDPSHVYGASFEIARLVNCLHDEKDGWKIDYAVVIGKMDLAGSELNESGLEDKLKDSGFIPANADIWIENPEDIGTNNTVYVRAEDTGEYLLSVTKE